jgi:hypothetical protein
MLCMSPARSTIWPTEAWRHGVQPACVVPPGRSGGSKTTDEFIHQAGPLEPSHYFKAGLQARNPWYERKN